MFGKRLFLLWFVAAMVALFAYGAEPLPLRGYYFTLGRAPTLGLPEWREILDGIREDGGNMVLLWMGGTFRSRKFPVTWQYNREHRNVQTDFVRELIDHAQTRGIKVLLGITPFSYDGVNQYTFEHPELKATQKNGNLAALSGLHCWGFALNPSRPEAQEFMLAYTREMLFDFYPNADGLMIESSDYATCHCRECQGRYYEREFQFVQRISDELWRAKAEAMIVVYPHYFSGRAVPGLDVVGARLKFDPRWTLFFTPHSAPVDPDLLQTAKKCIWWDTSPVLGSPPGIMEGARKARSLAFSGYVPTLEGFSFRMTNPEGSDAFLVGKRLKPFGFGWLPDGKSPYRELLIRVNRIAYREFTQDPALDYAVFKQRLGREIFGAATTPAAIDDLLFLQESFFKDRSWFSASPLVAPWICKGKLELGALSLSQLSDYRDRLRRIEEVARRYADSTHPAIREMHRIARWITDNWQGDSMKLLLDHLR